MKVNQVTEEKNVSRSFRAAERKKNKKGHLQQQRCGRNENPRNLQKNPLDLTRYHQSFNIVLQLRIASDEQTPQCFVNYDYCVFTDRTIFPYHVLY